MTIGKKIKEARTNCGLSQEQLAEKLNVSRSAVAKWETDKGIPDIENLKLLSSSLSVSIDFLLDNDANVDKSVIREAYDLSAYGKGLKKTRKDRVMLEKFPHCEIYTIIGKQKLTKGEKIIDNLLAFFTDAGFGTPDVINGIKHLDRECYLVNKDGSQYFVIVYDDVIEMHKLDIGTPLERLIYLPQCIGGEASVILGKEHLILILEQILYVILITHSDGIAKQ